MKQILPISLLFTLSSSCIKAPDFSGYQIPTSQVASNYCNLVLESGTYDQRRNLYRQFSGAPGSVYLRKDGFLPNYDSLLLLTPDQEPETLVFRISTPSIQDEKCVEIFYDNIPIGELNPKEDYFGIQGNCEMIYSPELAKQLINKTNNLGIEEMYQTFPLTKTRPSVSNFLEARYLETLKIAKDQF
jgi:hypothetical protein